MSSNTGIGAATGEAALREEVSHQHQQINVARAAEPGKDTRNRHAGAQWFADAGLGLFIHNGISSVFGTGDLSWCMMKRPAGWREEQVKRWGLAALQVGMSPQKYWSQAQSYNPSAYAPSKWLSAARQMGATYAVFTTRHHDGYAMWPSRYGDFSTRTHMGGRDLVKEYVLACRENGLKVGLYFSPPDWYFNRGFMSFHYGGNPILDTRHQPATLPGPEPMQQQRERFHAYLRGQLTELLTQYGQIDLLWLDGSLDGAMSLEEIRQLQPQIVVNDRGHGSADFSTPECQFPAQRPTGWWEECHILNDGGWGYLKHEIYKPAGWLLTELTKARAWGGNLLINVAPNAQGELPDVAYRRMEQVTQWMAHSARAVFGAAAGDWPADSNVPVTRRTGVCYLHPAHTFEGRIELRLEKRPSRVSLLRGGVSLAFDYIDGMLNVAIPDDLRTELVDTVEVVAG